MRPSAVEVIQSIQFSFERHIAPRLREPQAKSAAVSIRALLRHLELRLEREGPWLYEDNEAMRGLFRELAEGLTQALGGKRVDVLEKLASELREAGRERQERVPPHVVEEENTRLKELLDWAITTIHENKSALGQEAYATLKRPIRAYLRRELQRVTEYITPAFSGPFY